MIPDMPINNASLASYLATRWKWPVSVRENCSSFEKRSVTFSNCEKVMKRNELQRAIVWRPIAEFGFKSLQ